MGSAPTPCPPGAEAGLGGQSSWARPGLPCLLTFLVPPAPRPAASATLLPPEPQPQHPRTWGLPSPLQAMMTLQLIMFALVTGHVGGETRIIKGYECPPHSQPWQAALFQKTRLLCGATLIAPRWLLTAAHCRKPRYVVRLGAHSLQRQEGCEQTRTATESFPHPDFNNSLPNRDHRNDIMLVKMRTPAHLTWAVRPLTVSPCCVPAGANCLISGWGTMSSPQLHLPRNLRCANVTIIKHGECEDAYPGNITDTMVCASVRKEGKDSCQGDSGGPLVCNGSLQGIISWGQDPCAVSKKPGVYTKRSPAAHTAGLRHVFPSPLDGSQHRSWP
ncbi:hypothetical protein R6Z07M_013566 [Ovis aries]